MSATMEQLEALPEGAVVRGDINIHAVCVKIAGRWNNPLTSFTSSDLLAEWNSIEVLYPQPEPDHSMCARLVPEGDKWVSRHPNGLHAFALYADQARDRGYPIPDDRTVGERARDAIDELWAGVSPDADSREIVARLAELGLLVKDGEHDD